MLKDLQLPKSLSYSSGDEYDPMKFHLECLMNSNKLDLLLGYFSSSAINLLSVGFASFIHRGGKIWLAINNILSEKDKEAIEKGINSNVVSDLIDINNLSQIYNLLSEYNKHFFECLAWLIAYDKIEFVVITPKRGKGIAHYKEGIYYDNENAIAFSGSPNFTAYGLTENLETIDCFPNWINGNSDKVEDKISRISNIIEYRDEDKITYLNIDNIKTEISQKFGNKEIDELLIEEKKLFEKQNSYFEKPYFEDALNYLNEQIDILAFTPKFPYGGAPHKYQVEAYDSWLDNNRRGLFAMATGTGKTITSLNCILNDYNIFKYYKFIVLVPTTALVKQWQDEVNVKFNFQNTYVCCSLNSSWREELNELGKNIVFGREANYGIITTYATFKGKNFQGIFRDLFQTEFNKITIIADEAHTLGSSGFLKVLPTYIDKRIGLSATPERQFDDDGNAKLIEFFDTTAEGYTYVYNMKTAIENNVLCRYYYHPIIVNLEQEEQEEYLKITNELAKHFDQEAGRYKESDYVNMLLIKRKNVIHKANRKVTAIINIVAEIGAKNFKKAFIYVPEGITVDYTENDNFDATQANENEKLIDIYLNKLFNNYSLRMAKFTGETRNRDQILEQFKDGKLDALLAMKCLDEGVDVPQTKYAIFCSSTGNPRQYVQRRGRVLRKHKEKDFAIIYDLIVKPTINHTDTNGKLSSIEKNIFLSELRRLVNFAVLSENKDNCLAELETLCYDLDIDIYDLANKELDNYK
ncbi:DEAD/DEAH box helicase family protein [Chryseobacterium gregarium]|uniref:DEAD/DEAH box helicase family protein n=1 Tax=Chryseobacterium gregarium TaxID=456299 RepID=UPI0004223EC1|nr:DEAD/DEAH box helicase family protein [Chryseobacterium gregarium]